MSELEIEVTYLAKYLPKNLEECERTNIHDKYIKTTSPHKLRLRKKDDKFELTKKSQQYPEDASVQIEETIKLNEDEFNVLMQLPGIELHKIRYFYNYNGLNMELDMFQDALEGLVSIDCEFPTEREKNTFVMPDFCLVDVTQEKFIAQVQGKTYADLEPILSKYSYKKI